MVRSTKIDKAAKKRKHHDEASIPFIHSHYIIPPFIARVLWRVWRLFHIKFYYILKRLRNNGESLKKLNEMANFNLGEDFSRAICALCGFFCFFFSGQARRKAPRIYLNNLDTWTCSTSGRAVLNKLNELKKHVTRASGGEGREQNTNNINEG